MDRINELPAHIQRALLYDVVWQLFGDIDEDGTEYIDPDYIADVVDTTTAIACLHETLFVKTFEPRVTEVIRTGELEIEPGHTMAEIIEQASACLDRACSWDICGEILFRCDDDFFYTATVELVIGLASPDYVADAMKCKANEEEDDVQPPDRGDD
jgi:hypothetical protein